MAINNASVRIDLDRSVATVSMLDDEMAVDAVQGRFGSGRAGLAVPHREEPAVHRGPHRCSTLACRWGSCRVRQARFFG